MQHEGEDESSHNDTVSLPNSTALHMYTILYCLTHIHHCLRHIHRICTALLCLDAASLAVRLQQSHACNA